MTDADVTVSTPSQRHNLVQLLWGILAKPRLTFAYLREHEGRAWLVIALLLVLFTILPAVISGPLRAEQAREQVMAQLEAQPNFQGREDVDVEQAAAFTSSPLVTTVFPAVGAVVGAVVSWLIWSGSLHLIISMTGGRSAFRQMLQIVIWSRVPYGIRGLLQTIYLGVTSTLIENPGLSGFVPLPQAEPGAIFTPPSAGTLILRAFLGQIEIYLFWYLALLVIGLAAMAKLPRRKAIGLVLIVWAIFLGVRLAGTAVSGSLAGGFVG